MSGSRRARHCPLHEQRGDEVVFTQTRPSWPRAAGGHAVDESGDAVSPLLLKTGVRISMTDCHCRQFDSAPAAASPTTEQYAQSLLPSYLRLDTDGRVFRMDSFAKTVSPGARVGWVTAARPVVERVMRVHEVSTQHPSGLSQVALYRLLHDEWGHAGWARWMRHICAGYRRRRDVMVGACEASLPREVVGWKAPSAGFFMWLTIDWRKHPQAETLSAHEVEQAIYDAAIRHQVLVVPGSWFLVDQGRSGMDTVCFRMTFAAPATNAIPDAVKALGHAIREVFRLG
ncbi:aromatic amino acid aminotransferase [Apiospora marii]|uniref:aromatic amino acid aminotransferase n=1 Tax=Apiospora marii TaxID=335849 RepID=UPI00312DF7B3